MLAQVDESTTEQSNIVQPGGSMQTQHAPMQDAPLIAQVVPRPSQVPP
jgi:hypothetical protein